MRIAKVSDVETQPILVYQMGKVGSSSIKKTLIRAGYCVEHFHYFSGDFASPDPPMRERLGVDDLLGGGYKIISLVRDPIARNVSAFFQNLRAFGLEDDSVSARLDWFLNKYPWQVPLNWFDAEFKVHTGIDVFAYTFDVSRGWGKLLSGDLSVLLLQVEISDEAKQRAIADFLGHPIPAIAKANNAADKAYAKEYRAFLSEIRLSEALVTEMLGSKYVTHFYSPSQIAKFKDHWEKKIA